MPDPRPDVSVVLVVLNGAPWIGQQLDALARQRDVTARWEVIVSDNGSTDGTPQIVADRIDTFPVPLRVIDASGTPGASHARNMGASAARAPLLAFCDCDDVVADSWVDEAVSALADHACVGGSIRALVEPHDPDSEVLNPSGLHGRGIVSCNFAVRRETFFAVGGFDESLPPYGCEDSEFSLRVLARGVPIVPAPKMLLYFRRTVGLRRTLSKVYMSGVAETIVWQRHPGMFGEVRLRDLVSDVLRWPARSLRDVASRRVAPRELARSGVTTWAHLVGHLTWVRNGQSGAARLVFQPYDIP